MKAKEQLFDNVQADIDYQIRKGDCLTVLKKVEDGIFDLVLTSPPYNVGKSYEAKTSIENIWKRRKRLSAKLSERFRI